MWDKPFSVDLQIRHLQIVPWASVRLLIQKRAVVEMLNNPPRNILSKADVSYKTPKPIQPNMRYIGALHFLKGG